MNQFKVGQKVRALKIPDSYKSKELFCADGVVKMIAKSGKVMATMNKWNYWFKPEDLQPISVDEDLNVLVQDFNQVASGWTKNGKPLSTDAFLKSFMTPEVAEEYKRKFPITMTTEEKERIDKMVTDMFNRLRHPLFQTGSVVRHKENGKKYEIQTHLKEFDKDNQIVDIYYFVIPEGQKDNKPEIYREDMLTDDPPTKKFKALPRTIQAYKTDKDIVIKTLEGDMKASAGDWIVIGVKGERYPVKPDIFSICYEEILPDPTKPAKKLKEGDAVIMLSNRESDVVEKDMNYFDPSNGWMFRLKSGRLKGERELMTLTEYDEKKTIQPSSPYPKSMYEEGRIVALPSGEKNTQGLVEHKYFGDNGWVYSVKIFDELNNKFESKQFDERQLSNLA